MIELKESDFIAEGKYQKCYKHPLDKNLCVKISKYNVTETRLASELNYSKKISQRDSSKFDYPFFSHYYGEKTTNFGTGYVHQLIRDETTSKISKTLEYYLLTTNCILSDEILSIAFERLKLQMIKHKVIANNIRSKNICCKILKDNSVQLILVDGLGHRDFLPLVDWFSFFAKKKIERHLLKWKLHDIKEQREYLKQELALLYL